MKKKLSGWGSRSKALAGILDEIIIQPVVVVAWEDHRVLYINHQAEEYFGIAEERAVGKYAEDFWVNPEERQRFVQKVDADGGVKDFEARLRTCDGEGRYVLLSTREIEFEGQRALCSVFTDITERKRMEKELRDKDARNQEMYSMMRLMADTVPDMLWVKDLKNRYLFANPAIRKNLICCSPEEDVLGKDDLYFATRERENGRKHTFGETCINSDEVVKSTRKAGRFLEEGLVRGKKLILDVHKAPLFNSDGELIGTVGAGRDVTQDMITRHELEKSEELFRLLAENVRDVLWITDEDFVPSYVSPAIESLSGYSPEEFMVIPVEEHMSPVYRRKFLALKRIIHGKLDRLTEFSSRFLEFECYKKDGDIIWVEIMVSLILDVDGGVKGYAGVIRDSTRRVRAQQRLTRAREAAIAASQTKSDFLANMSHEIRTPLNGVLGLLQLLKDTRLDNRQCKYVETAISSGKSLLSIISDILDFSKIEAGKVVLENSPFELEPLVGSVVNSFHSLVDRTKVAMGYKLEPDVPACIVIDGSRLKQILFNLVGNAVKFTHLGQINVRVAVHKAENGVVSELLFAVHDTGIGVSDSVAPHLFEPFVQQDNSFRRKHGGTGLGLSIVKQLVSRMGGTVALSSSPGRGTVVSVYLPVTVVDGDGPGNAGQDMARLELPEMKILVVEDEGINAMVITTMLERLGQKPVHVENGREALKRLEEEQFDCVLMDIQMPELDGMETTQKIRRLRPGDQGDIAVIALTAHATSEDRARCMGAGMNGYLTKPVEFSRLADVLVQVVRNSLSN